MKRKVKIAVLVSGGGTNLQAIIDYEKAGKLSDGELVKVISSKEGAYALTRAENAGIEGVVVAKKGKTQREFEQGIIAELEKSSAEVIVLAGFNLLHSENYMNNVKV
jgi:phosphoribosylglycinamide formyltransferase-1